MVMSSLPFELVKGWHSSPFRCGDGVIVLFPQDGPPHQKPARAMLAGPRPTDRYKDRLTVSRFASQVENQPNLTVFPYTTEVVDPAPIRLLSSSLSVLSRARPAVVRDFHVIMGGRRRLSRPRDYAHMFCAMEGNLFVRDEGTSE
jgi:hypothetical protein